MPELPFSLLDKTENLAASGFKKMLIDFSKTKILKSDIRNLVSIIQKHEFIEGASRFNWKNGFYNPEKMEAYQAAQARNAQAAKDNKKRK